MTQEEINGTQFLIYEESDGIMAILKFIRNMFENSEKFSYISINRRDIYVYEKEKKSHFEIPTYIGCEPETVCNILTRLIKSLSDPKQKSQDENNESKELNKFLSILKNKDYKQEFNGIQEQLKEIKEEIKHLSYQQDHDQTQILMNKIENLETKLGAIDTSIKDQKGTLKQINVQSSMQKEALREVRDKSGMQDDYLNKILKTVNNIPATMMLMSDKIDNFAIPEVKVEEEKEDIEITNPDAKLLKEMFETSQKLNEMILKVALSMSEDHSADNNPDKDMTEDKVDENGNQ